MYDLAGEYGLDMEALRARLRRMSDDALNRFGRLHGICVPRKLTSAKNRARCS